VRAAMLLQALVGGSGSAPRSGPRSGGRRRRRSRTRQQNFGSAPLRASGANASRVGNREMPSPDEVDEIQRSSVQEVLELLTDPPELGEDDHEAPQVLVNALKEPVPDSLAESHGVVLLHVYNLNEDLTEVNQNLNFSSDVVAIGGVFHVATEVYGCEWAYGVCGMTCIPPRSEEAHVYQCTVYMGRTQLTQAQLAPLLFEMAQNWRGAKYDIIGRNCCSFATELCARLGVGELPCWVDRFARLLQTGREAGLAALEVGRSLPGIIEREVVRFTTDFPVQARALGVAAMKDAQVMVETARPHVEVAAFRAKSIAAELGQQVSQDAQVFVQTAQPAVEEAASHVHAAASVMVDMMFQPRARRTLVVASAGLVGASPAAPSTRQRRPRTALRGPPRKDGRLLRCWTLRKPCIRTWGIIPCAGARLLRSA